MQSMVSICNVALARLGGNQLERINSPDEGGAAATLCRTLFPHVTALALAYHPWAFATKRATLALKETDVEGNYPLRFSLPEDCLLPVRLTGEIEDHAPTPHVVEGDDLLTSANPAVLLYVARQEDTSVWPVFFADAVAWGMAAELATSLINDPRRQQWYGDAFQRALADASGRDLAGQRMRRNRCPWLESRE